MLMFQLLYYSRADEEFTEAAIGDLAGFVRAQNHRRNITGGLVYRDGWFAQVLEGDHAAVCDLYHGAIIRDPRHRDIRLVRAVQVDRRTEIANWLGYAASTQMSDALCLRFGPTPHFTPDRMTAEALSRMVIEACATALHIIEDRSAVPDRRVALL